MNLRYKTSIERLFAPKHITKEVSKPARAITNVGSSKVISAIYSLKNGQLINCESTLERDAVFNFERDSEVSSFRSQPETIHFRVAGKATRWTPDFELIRADRPTPIWIEVKPSFKTLEPGFCEKQDQWISISARHGREYRLLTEKDIRVEPRLTNTRALYRYARVPLTEGDRDAIIGTLKVRSPMTIRELTDSLGREWLPSVYSALWSKVIECPGHLQVGSNLPVYLPGTAS